MSDPYSVGTTSVANGGTTVTGTDTFWAGKVRKNDLFTDPAQGIFARVTADATSNTAISINAWPGTALSGAAYEIIPAGDATTSAARLRDLLAQMSVVEANSRGLFYRFSDTVADADPGAGYFRLNNVDPALATLAFIDVLDANGATVAGEVDTWDDSSSLRKGSLWLRSITDRAVFRAYSVTGSVVDGTGYRKLTLTHIGGSGSFRADDELMVAFAATGDAGDGYITDADVADPSDLTALEGEDPGYLVFVADLETNFGAYSGRSGVVRLIAGPAWELVAVYTGPKGDKGDQGDKGWTQNMVTVSDGARRVQKLAGYVGGEGSAPTENVGLYRKGDGTWTANIAEAADVRGPGGAGTVGEIVPGAGIAVDNSDPTAPVISVTNAEPVGYDNLLTSSSIMAIQISDNSNAALFMGDGVADAFDALTYVDVAGATNLNSATPGVLKPTIGSDTFASSGSLGLTSNLTLYGGYSTRERVPAGVITGDGDGIRLTLRPPTSGSNTPIDDVWVGHAGTGANFDGTQVRVTFSGGSTGVTLTAGGSVVVSDLIPYAFDDSKDLIVAFDFGATADVRGRTGLTGYNSYQKAATSGESGSTTVSGYTANADMVVVIDTIEVRTAIGTPNNMTVLSASFAAPVIPDTMRAILLIKEVGGSSAAGTDYTFECSRDGGTTLDAMTLTEKYTLQNGITVVEADALDVTSQPSANNPRWRFDTLNNKNVELHGVHFLWPTGSSP